MGRFGKAYILDNFEDLKVIKRAAAEKNVRLPDLIVTPFDVERYPEVQKELPFINADCSGVVCNMILEYAGEPELYDPSDLNDQVCNN